MRILPVVAALSLLCPPLFVQSPAGAGPGLADEVIGDLVRRLPAFAPGGTRASVSVARQMAIPGSDGCGHFAEILWREGEVFRGGLLSIGCTDAPHMTGATWLARQGRWGVLGLQEDMTWSDLIRQLGDARISSFESAAIGRVRTMASAQATLAAVGGGAYAGSIECLVTPSACGVASTIGFLDPSFGEAEAVGYRFTLHAGELATNGARDRVRTYAYTAVPLTPGETGRRSFCTDSAGALCERTDGKPFEIRAGQCPAGCAALR
ncbi:MAG: hypothetical protein NDJ94_11705 [Vicinamibacteria bacterium]|nr:hypothetical protein [Vicinamibacteria bacterium]